MPSRHTGGSKTAGNGTINDMGMYVYETILPHLSRERMAEDRFVAKHRCVAYADDRENMRTPSPEPHMSADDAPPPSDEGVHEVTLEAYRDKPLEARPGVVEPAGH